MTRDPTIGLLRELIAIDSVNPSLVPGGAGEERIARFVAEKMRSFGLEVSLPEAAPGRRNAIGVLEGRGPGGRSLVLCGHLDTVGVQGMTSPFDPVEREGRIYGRGAQDMKGGLAAILGAAERVARSGGLAAGRLVIAAVADEEHASLGAEAFARSFRGDAAVVAEPTDLAIATAHKGFSWVEVETFGRAAHGSRPEEGRDAILAMGRVLGRVGELGRRLEAGPRHRLLGPASLHASTIHGGREWSTYPDRCVLELERRTLPGEKASAAAEEIEALLRDLAREIPEFRASSRAVFERPAYETPAGHPIVSALDAALERAGRRTTVAGMSYWTDAAVLGGAGTPSVVSGRAARAFTASRNTSSPRRCSFAAMCSRS